MEKKGMPTFYSQRKQKHIDRNHKTTMKESQIMTNPSKNTNSIKPIILNGKNEIKHNHN